MVLMKLQHQFMLTRFPLISTSEISQLLYHSLSNSIDLLTKFCVITSHLHSYSHSVTNPSPCSKNFYTARQTLVQSYSNFAICHLLVDEQPNSNILDDHNGKHYPVFSLKRNSLTLSVPNLSFSRSVGTPIEP